MTGAKAYAIGYAAHTARHEDFHRIAAERRRALAASSRPRRRFGLRLRRRSVQPAARSATTAA